MTEKETDMQFLLHLVEIWCSKWRLEVNLTKTNIMHVRGPRCSQSKFMFLFNKRQVNYCTSYRYLGVTLNELELDYNFTADLQSEPAGRALGAIITYPIIFIQCFLNVAVLLSQIMDLKYGVLNQKMESQKLI